MELALFVYFAGIVSKLSGLFVFIAIASGISGLICLAAVLFDNDKSYQKSVYICLTTWLCSALIATLLPSEKTMYLMAGAYTTQAVAQSTVGQKTVELIEQKLDEELAKLKEKK